MTISNETKVGALTSISIVLLILGFNFLKGKNLSSNKTRYYAVFDNIQGLSNSNPVFINGKEVGTVFSTDGGDDMKKITVGINMKIFAKIPKNSIATVTSSILGNTSLDIKLGNEAALLNNGDTISTIATANIMDAALQKVDPILAQTKIAVKSLDSVLNSVNSVLDIDSKNNIKGMLQNLNKTTASLTASSASLQSLLNSQSGVLAKTMSNVSSFTGSLSNNNDKLNTIMGNVEKTSANFSKIDLEKTLTTLNGSVAELKTTIGKINSTDGSIGLLMNDTKLYNNLNATSNKINLLLDDVRMHPKRYINVSVFGKKDKSTPLMVPLADTVNAPYTNP